MKLWNPLAVVFIHMKNVRYMCNGSCFNFLFHVLCSMSDNIRKNIASNFMFSPAFPGVIYFVLLRILRFYHSSPQNSLRCDFRSFSATQRASQHIKVHSGIYVNSYFNTFGIFFSSTSLCILAEKDFLFDWNTMTSTNCLQPSNCWDLTQVKFNFLFTKSVSSFFSTKNASGFLIRNFVLFWEI